MNRLSTLTLGLAVAACSGSETSGPGTCEDNADCDPGRVCSAGGCELLCSSDLDCSASQICDGSLCIAGGRQTPVIEGVDGDSGTPCAMGQGSNCVRGGIVVNGQRLLGAQFRLTPSSGNPGAERVLTARSGATDGVTVLDLPNDVDYPNVSGGQFTLTATNNAGTDQAPLTFLQGEPGSNFTPTGNQLVDSVNAATNQINSARLFVGTGSSDVAAGNHNHDAAYAASAHNHDTAYASAMHNHDMAYAASNHPGLPKTWVSFRGTGTPTMLKSFGVISVTRVSAGNYRIVWTTPFADTNYLVFGTCNLLGSGGSKFGLEGNNIPMHTWEHVFTTSVDVGCRDSTNANNDVDLVHVMAFGD